MTNQNASEVETPEKARGKKKLKDSWLGILIMLLRWQPTFIDMVWYSS